MTAPAPTPKLPEPVHAELDSMLTRKFGREVANYFSGSPLNRVSFLRTDHPFLSAALKHPSTSFLLYNNLAPLARDPAHLAFLTYKDVQPVVGDDPFAKSEEQIIAEYNSTVTQPLLVFLGIDEANKDGMSYKHYKGAPYFAVDITPKGTLEKAANGIISEMESRGYTFIQGRAHMNFSSGEGSIFAMGRALIDWNTRNPYCAQCGQPTLSINAGTKRACPPADLATLSAVQAGATAATPTQRPPCATRNGISNVSFPRTDPTIITAVVSHDGQRILLGRQKRWPPYWYSTLAGFCEPAESVEEAVRREVWEESGVHVGRVVIHSTQPWPYPANLMIGAIAQATPTGEQIVLENDPELEDAKWVSFEEVSEALKNGTSGLGEPPAVGYKEGSLRLPPSTAIANQLLSAVVGGFLGGENKL